MSRKRIVVAVGLLRNARGEVLVARRRADQHLAGLLEFPGGKVEADETVPVALARELAEELDIQVDLSAIGAAPWMEISYDYPDKQVLLDVREVFYFHGEPHGREGQPVQWLDPRRMQSDQFPPADEPIIDKLRSFSGLTHLDARGHANMVDVGGKDLSRREARAMARVRMQSSTLTLLVEGGHPKGDVFAVCRIAGIQAAKKTHELIPLCHALSLSSVKVDLYPEPDHGAVRIETCCRVLGQTGVEMEALTAASVAALTLYDMCKARDRGITIESVCLLEKSGGASGHWRMA